MCQNDRSVMRWQSTGYLIAHLILARMTGVMMAVVYSGSLSAEQLAAAIGASSAKMDGGIREGKR